MAEQRGHIPVPVAVPLVGREREQAALRGYLALALAGRGSLVLIGGDAGIGKTAFAEAALAEAADGGALPLVGRCYDLSETPPYGPWAEAFDRAARAAGVPPPDLARGGGTGNQAALFAAVRDYLAALAARQPLVLLLDDLHWADPASLDLLRALARGLAELPLLLLATYRADELTRRHPLYQLLPVLVREARAARIDLRPLKEAGLRALIHARYALAPDDESRLVAYLSERSEGNPFFAGELVRSLEEELILRRADPGGWMLGDLAKAGVPLLLRQVLDARVDRLGEAARELLAVAAVIGQVVPFDIWAAVADRDGGALLAVVEVAFEAHLLVATTDGSAVQFSHALIREALYEGTLPLRRRVWHRRAAEVLESVPGVDPDAVAYHYRQVGDARAVPWLVRAGERAQRAAAALTAAERFETALAQMETTGDDLIERGWLLLRIARLRRFADPSRSVTALEEAEHIGTSGGDQLLTAIARYWRGESRSYTGEFRRGLDELESGFAIFETLSEADLARLSDVARTVIEPGLAGGTLAAGLALSGRYADFRALRSRIAARQSTLPGIFVYPAAIIAAADGRPMEASELFRRARAIYRTDGNAVGMGSAVFWELAWCTLPYLTDQLAMRHRLVAEGAAAWQQAGGAQGDASTRMASLSALAVEGAWQEARTLAEAGLTPEISALRRALYAGVLGRIVQAQGEGSLAWRWIREFLPQGPDTAPGDCNYLAALALQRLAASLALDEGDLPLARRWLVAHDTWLDWSGAILGRADGALGWAAYQRVTSDPAAAREHAARAIALATEVRQPLVLLATHRLLGELGTGDGRLGEASVHLTEALALAEACAAPYERALTLLALAELQIACGDPTGAASALGEVRAICTGLGALPVLARCDALASKLAADNPDQAGTSTAPHHTSARPLASAPPVRLTPREAEVLRLIATGKSNREMAEALCRSERTVERHIESLYRKIDAHNRADATAFAFRHGLA